MPISPVLWSYVPDDTDAGSMESLQPLFDDLLARPLDTGTELEQFLADESELFSRFGAEVARRYIRMTCHTNDAEAKDAYLTMQRDVVPNVRVLGDRLDRKLLASPALGELDADRYAVVLRNRRAAIEIFSEANTELQRRQAELQTRQQEIMGAVEVTFEDKAHTLQQMAPYAQDQDRGRRQRAFEASLEARRATWEPLQDVYDELVTLRDRMATNAGHEDYVAYRFVDMRRFDYSPDDCVRFHDAVVETVVPAVQRLNDTRREALGVDSLRPWDLDVDAEGRPPFRPFESQDQLIAITRELFRAVDPRFESEFALLIEHELLDLMSRSGKAPGGYQYQLEDIRLPFIFANGVGVHSDVQTLLHEGGHAFHSILCRNQSLYSYRHSPIEFAETASMSMELMGLEHLAQVYGAEEARAARRHHLEGILRILPWIASIDGFQHWVYRNVGASRDERIEAWTALRARMAPGIDFSGCEDALAHQWLAQGHLFGHPLYYIEYGIAQLAALQVWLHYRQDPSAAVAAYRDALALGGSKPLPELFATAGVRFDLGPELMAELVSAIEVELR